MLAEKILDEVFEKLALLSREQKLRVIEVLASDLRTQEQEEDEDPDFIEDEATMSPAKKELLEGLKQSIHEAMTGQTYPIDSLWEMLAEDDQDDENHD